MLGAPLTPPPPPRACGTQVATGGDDHKVRVWHFESAKMVCEGVGHSRTIMALQFSPDDKQLVSVGEDRCLVEYDLARSTVEGGVRLVDAPRRIEQSAVPTACAWHPLLGGGFEDRVITASSEYKLKEWNADNKHCRRTSVGPTFGGPLNRLVNLQERAFSTGQVRASSRAPSLAARAVVLASCRRVARRVAYST